MHLNIFESLTPAKVVEVDGKFIPLDLSVGNPAIQYLQGSADYEIYIQNFLHHNKAAAAYGGYDEQRNIYKRSAIFENNGFERDIHIGIDIWAKAGTQVNAALDGTIHSYNYNIGVGNYGPTIILKHEIDNTLFFTLYGHLSQQSIEGIAIGDIIAKGQKIGTLGNASENGDYAPHLHFQIIKDLNDYFGDYPGVCSVKDRKYFLENCPDPNLLLKLKL